MTAPQRQRCPDFAAILRATGNAASVHEQVVACFYEEMSKLALLRCRDAELAQDATQEAMMMSIESLGSFRGDSPLEHWLRKLIISACSRLRRGRRNDPRYNVPLDEASDESVDSMIEDPAQEVRLMMRERFNIIALAVSELDDPNRSLLLLHEGQEVPLDELAKRFDLTVEGVKARLKRTRAQLRKRLLAAAEEPVAAA